MDTTADYGTWADHGDGETTPTEYVGQVLGEWAGDYKVPDVIKAFTDAVNDALPAGVTLNGAMFYGPHAGRTELIESGAIADAVQSVDFWAIADRCHKEGQ